MGFEAQEISVVGSIGSDRAKGRMVSAQDLFSAGRELLATRLSAARP